MSSRPDLAQARGCQIESSTARHDAATETWPIEARTLLASIAVAMAIGLWALAPGSHSASGGAFAVAPSLVVDANSAPPQVIEALPTLGPTLVGRWVAARAERPFASLADARRRLRGLGPSSLTQIAPYLAFESRPASPPNVDEKSGVLARTNRESIKTADITGERVGVFIGRR